ncbi:unnamed protein product [Fusarium venenatum]|uniref:DUF7600 domain-containing protein n=1 Tax=Fusarium venenatum TaxID=56646 RepID=A0A2L2TPI8_9HYPO|nr:uncharacterized protein FVRRES_07056 [Fusarium venenatum]CEI62620.1 unnamed protein product [Fusarium venenatum]
MTVIQEIMGFIVALDERGVRGLSIIDENKIESQWIGDHQNIPKWKICSRLFGGLVKTLKCGFDHPEIPKSGLIFQYFDYYLTEEDALGRPQRPVCFATFVDENPEKLSRIVV